MIFSVFFRGGWFLFSADAKEVGFSHCEKRVNWQNLNDLGDTEIMGFFSEERERERVKTIGFWV